jgi:PAS domain S-box-containing protein
MSSLQRFLGRLGFPYQLGLIVAFFAITVLCLLALVASAFRTMSGVRAYVGGEGHWSKAQKAAVRALDNAAGGDARALVRFDAVMMLPLGDRLARRELERPRPDPSIVAQGLIAGRNHPDDVGSMAMVFRRLRHVPHVDRAIDIWTRADREIVRLTAVARRLRVQLAAPERSPREIARIRRKVATIDGRVTPLEDGFSAALADGARLLGRVLLILVVVAATALLALGVLVSRLVLRAVRERDERQGRADVALRASEERYRELFDDANDLVYAHDLAGVLTAVNRACLRATGYAHDELVGRNISMILAPEALARAREMLARKVDGGGGSTVYELEILARDGHSIPVEVSTRLVVEDGRPVAVHGIARDISERKRAEAALAVEARLAASLARVGRELMSSLDTPVLFDRLCQASVEGVGGGAGVIALWEPTAARYVRTAACGASVAAAEHVLVELGPPSRLFDTTSVALLAPTTMAIALRRDGEIVGVQILVAPSPLADEHRGFAEGVAIMVSMALANADLVSRLEEANRLRSEFVSTMSHELRTPLNVMLGYTEMLRDEPEETARWALLERMEASGRDLLELIESTLDLGRIEAGRDTVQLETISLRTLLLAVGASCSRFPRRGGVTLRWPVDPPDCALTTDPRKLTVVLRNLVGNALKFTEHGSVGLEAALDGDTVVLHVRDTGIGIRPDDHERIFDMFRQADGSDSRRFGGTGLGLYIVRRFVRRLGGTVTVTSTPGRGSTFTVTLPRNTTRVANAA